MALVGAFALATGCGQQAGDDTSKAVKSVNDYFPLKVGGLSIQVQYAVHMTEMSQGLMHRRDLGPSQGMIFVYMRPGPMSFYMKNTPTPLDIGFFTEDGVLREIYQVLPLDERSVQSVGKKMQFALEMNRGWFSENGVRPGAKLDLAGVEAALKARGFAPSEFGLGAK